ncbi:hypothetical protein QO207_24160 [Pseudomonas sp. CAN2814]|jgi:predicted transcriptional regulator|uniref:hypothetical protein n=1 Tax=Pseudomonas sp. CAN1 TaxID=3046726 RepID=UPI0026482705|nr:hypothetical protein [Pseudomonas sp. CAN1]MDN6859692.1 hypothetical protein [Pseudomonas sp. CAN1]
MARSLAKSKGRRESGTFAAIPHAVMDSEDFRTLSGGALKVLLGLLRQYRGANNGDLSASMGQAKEWGVRSSSTLAASIKELMDCDLIIRTREGKFIKPGGCCALYAITWRPIDPCDEKIEVSPTTTAPRKFSLELSNHPLRKSNRHSSKIEAMEA